MLELAGVAARSPAARAHVHQTKPELNRYVLKTRARHPAPRCLKGDTSGSASQQSLGSDDVASINLKAIRSGQQGLTSSSGLATSRQLEEAWLEGRGKIGMVIAANNSALRATDSQEGERTPGAILSKIIKWPSLYQFTVVGAGANREQFVRDVRNCIARICHCGDIQDYQCTVTERMGGKWISIKVRAMVPAPEVVHQVFEELGKDPRVKMKF